MNPTTGFRLKIGRPWENLPTEERKMAGSTKGKKRIVFTYDDADAEEVVLAGDFNAWDRKKHRMVKTPSGLWERTVMLVPGRHEYKFRVDGQWLCDPKAGETCPNEFGTHNSVVKIVKR
jgi:1,4-alpha-glucan branching enzyme